MDSEVAPGFIFDQGLYYPAAANYYEYYCTGMESPNEWDDHHKFLGLDGQDLQFSGMQTESLPYVYYTPNYEYAQSPYNPYNPYIPGAVIGTDGTFIGTQQFFTNSSYQQTISPPAYIPVVVQSSSDTLPNGSPDPLLISTGGAKYTPPLSSMSVTPVPPKVSLENLTLGPCQSSSHQIQIAGRPSEGSLVNAAPSKQFSSYGAVTSGSAPQMTQGNDHSSHVRVPSVCSPSKVTMPANNGFTNFGSNVRGLVSGDRIRPRIQFTGVSNRSLGEQNRGPRINRLRGQLSSPIALRSYTTKAGTGNLDGNIIVYADQYNRDDFPVDHPDAKFFVIKSYSEDDVHKSIKYNVWSSTSSGNKRLDIAYEEAQRLSIGKPRKCPVFLLFSVNASGHFCGVAEMIGPVDFHKDMDFWQQDKWTGSFPVKWHIIKDVPNSSFRHIILVNNEYRPVTSSRDTQEIPYLPGISMLTIFKNSPLKTSILDDFMYYEEQQRIMQEEKTRLLGRSSYESSLFLPTFVPSNRLGGATYQPQKADEKQPNGTVVQPPIAVGEEPNAKTDRPSELDGKPLNYPTVDQDLKAEGKQLNIALGWPPSSGEKQPNGTAYQPPKTNGGTSKDANPPPRTDGGQPNHRVNQPLETNRIPTKHYSDPKGSVKLSSSDEQIITKHVAIDPQDDKKDAKPDSVGDANSVSSTVRIGSCSDSKIGDNDVLTVGSMQININKINSSFSGILTVGSIPVDTKGLKL